MQIFQINELTIFTDEQLTNNPKKQKRSKEEVGQSGTEYYDYVKWCFFYTLHTVDRQNFDMCTVSIKSKQTFCYNFKSC